MQNKTDIERVHKIDDVNVSTPIDLNDDLANKKAKGENKGVYYYAVPKDSALERLFDTLLEIIAGENRAGKIIGRGKDVLSYFVPLGREIDALTDQIGDMLKSNNKINLVMESTKEKIIRIIKQPSTKAAITGILTAIGLIFGLNVDAAGVASTLTESAVGVVTGLFGLYFVYRTIRNLFTDDAKVTANK